MHQDNCAFIVKSSNKKLAAKGRWTVVDLDGRWRQTRQRGYFQRRQRSPVWEERSEVESHATRVRVSSICSRESPTPPSFSWRRSSERRRCRVQDLLESRLIIPRGKIVVFIVVSRFHFDRTPFLLFLFLISLKLTWFYFPLNRLITYSK